MDAHDEDLAAHLAFLRGEETDLETPQFPGLIRTADAAESLGLTSGQFLRFAKKSALYPADTTRVEKDGRIVTAYLWSNSQIAVVAGSEHLAKHRQRIQSRKARQEAEYLRLITPK